MAGALDTYVKKKRLASGGTGSDVSSKPQSTAVAAGAGSQPTKAAKSVASYFRSR